MKRNFISLRQRPHDWIFWYLSYGKYGSNFRRKLPERHHHFVSYWQSLYFTIHTHQGMVLNVLVMKPRQIFFFIRLSWVGLVMCLTSMYEGMNSIFKPYKPGVVATHAALPLGRLRWKDQKFKITSFIARWYSLHETKQNKTKSKTNKYKNKK